MHFSLKCFLRKKKRETFSGFLCSFLINPPYPTLKKEKAGAFQAPTTIIRANIQQISIHTLNQLIHLSLSLSVVFWDSPYIRCGRKYFCAIPHSCNNLFVLNICVMMFQSDFHRKKNFANPNLFGVRSFTY